METITCTCPDCGSSFPNSKALGSHRRFSHKTPGSSRRTKYARKAARKALTEKDGFTAARKRASRLCTSGAFTKYLPDGSAFKAEITAVLKKHRADFMRTIQRVPPPGNMREKDQRILLRSETQQVTIALTISTLEALFSYSCLDVTDWLRSQKGRREPPPAFPLVAGTPDPGGEDSGGI